MTYCELLEWKGVHLFYGELSLCSRKVQLFLGLKSVNFTPHVIDLKSFENRSDYYLGVNPLGLVPCLVHDGEVIIESNDILMHIDKCFPDPPLQPQGKDNQRVMQLLDNQDAYHMDIRNLTFRYILPNPVVLYKCKATLAKMDAEDAKGVNDVADVGQGRAHQRAFFEDVLEHGGVTDEMILGSVEKFRKVLGPIDKEYAGKTHLLGGSLSMVDVAFWCDIERMLLCGFPVAAEFPNMLKMYEDTKKHLPADVMTLAAPVYIRILIGVRSTIASLRGSTIEDLMAGTVPTSVVLLLAPVITFFAGLVCWYLKAQPVFSSQPLP